MGAAPVEVEKVHHVAVQQAVDHIAQGAAQNAGQGKGKQPLLRVLAWIGIFTSIGTARNIWTLAKEKQKYVKYFCMVSAAASIVLNYVFIQWMGAMGAAIAIVLVNIIQALGAPLLFAESREFVTQYFGAFQRFSELPQWLRNRGKFDDAA